MTFIIGVVASSRQLISSGTSFFAVTVPSGTVSEDLTDYPLMIDMADMPAGFWTTVNSSGGNIRAYQSDAVTAIPVDVTYINTDREIGRIFVKHTLTTAADTVILIGVESPATTKLADANPNGRNAVWADYEVVWVFPEVDNRTGNAYAQTMNNTPHSEWTRVDYHEFNGNPHQGIATDSTGRVITIDTDFLRRYDDGDLTTELASNSTPIADTGIALVDHLGDGCIIGSELFLVLEEFPNSPYDNQHIVVFNADTLAYLRSYDISANTHEVSSVAYDGTDLWITDYTVGTSIYRYSTVGVLLETVTLSTSLIQMQGIEVVEGLLYISVEATGNPVYEVQTDGTVNGIIYNRPTNGINEGISYDGTHLWVVDGDGDVVKLELNPDRADWVKFHFDIGWAEIDPLSTTWTMATSIYWTVEGGDLQQGFLSYANLSNSNGRATLAYDDGPDVLSLWNSTDSWAASAIGLSEYTTFRVAGSHNGTTRRKIWHDGVSVVTDSPISARPSSGNTQAEFVVNGSQNNGTEDGEGYYQYLWMRHEEMSDGWMAADGDNMGNPSAFYSIEPAQLAVVEQSVLVVSGVPAKATVNVGIQTAYAVSQKGVDGHMSSHEQVLYVITN